MNVISENCDLKEFCSKVKLLDYMKLVDATSVEIAYQKILYRERTGEDEFPEGSIQAHYCEDLQTLINTLINGSFPEDVRSELVLDLVPLFNHLHKEIRFCGNIEEVLNKELAKKCSQEENLLQAINPLFIVISRQEIEWMNTSLAADALKQLIRSPDVVRSFQEKVGIAIDGYNHETQELYEIAKVRDFIYKLDEDFPFWLYFLSKDFSGLQFILLCFLPPFLTDETKAIYFPERIGELLEIRWIPAMNQIASFAGLGEDEITRLTDRTIQYITNGPLQSSNLR